MLLHHSSDVEVENREYATQQTLKLPAVLKHPSTYNLSIRRVVTHSIPRPARILMRRNYRKDIRVVGIHNQYTLVRETCGRVPPFTPMCLSVSRVVVSNYACPMEQQLRIYVSNTRPFAAKLQNCTTSSCSVRTLRSCRSSSIAKGTSP